MEPFPGRLRDERLQVQQLVTLADAQQQIDAWREEYHTACPHSFLGHLTPKEYQEIGQGKTIAEAA